MAFEINWFDNAEAVKAACPFVTSSITPVSESLTVVSKYPFCLTQLTICMNFCFAISDVTSSLMITASAMDKEFFCPTIPSPNIPTAAIAMNRLFKKLYLAFTCSP